MIMAENGAIKQIKVVLVEDHPMFRERLTQLIRADLHMDVCGEAEDSEQAMQVIAETLPDVVIVDITLAGSSGLQLIKDLRTRGNDVPILVLSMHDELLYAERVLRAGAMGYITKSEASSQVKLAIQTVIGGEIYLSAQMTTKVLQQMSKPFPESRPTGVASLSDRELEVYRLLGSGVSSKDIASQLGLGSPKVNSLRFRIREKLGIRSSAELYTRAAQWVKEHGG
jgi:DNA-binding NarL/FixJ family response regulator